ncbi:helix-turn-helix domain-containing protein [Nonomuraea endophytica]|uniref:helix-turn-helix domain-containing protein n=1 Tax=Nonomuraea endophytica TaxID=714136 RepID=UPI0037CC36C4
MRHPDTVIESASSLTESNKRLPDEGESPLRCARKGLGLSLRTTATRASIDPGHLSRVERGEKSLSVEALHRLAVVLELDELVAQLHPYLPRKRQKDG